ncbi:MAG: EAL domain-containing protein [Desulfuromonadales bacterium]|nr:EAL domain-containing protein [Desulfuromonadales bacterium]
MLKDDSTVSQLIARVPWLIVLLWSIVTIFIALLHAYGNRQLAQNSALIEARTLIKQEELSRYWIAANGGLYAASSGKGLISPPVSGQAGAQELNNEKSFFTISHNDITAQMYRRLEDDYGYRARMISLDSIRAEGVPDRWERDAFKTLTGGEDFFYEVVSLHGQDSLRLIHATRFQEECVNCHTSEYRVGELLGAFSLTLPLDSYYTALGIYSYSVLIGYLLLWLFGLLLTCFATSLFKRLYLRSCEQGNQLQLAETNLHYLAYFDPGTNLPNRATFDDRLRVAMAHAVRLNERVAIAVVNLENFTTIRGLYSQGVGEQLVKKVAEVIAGHIRPDDTIARMGNDRLLLLLPGLVSRENVARIVNNINRGFEESVALDKMEVFAKVSFGVSIFPDDASTSELLISQAETAAFRVAQQKISNLQMFSEEMNAAAHAHLQLETGLRHGLSRNEFSLYYQPQINVPAGSVFGAEVLIRWNHPERGLIMPDQFIPMAENNGSIVPIGEWVIMEACAQVVRWKNLFNIPFRLGVNISARQFQDVELVDLIDRVLQKTGIDPADLEIEITEGTIMENVDRAIETLIDLKVRGVKVAIDDFGTGYSSLSQLKKLPFDRLKVDRSFILDLDSNRDSQVIIEMIIDLAAKLNMEIIAEGIETEQQKNFLISRGCYLMQGYLFARPMPADDFTRFLESSQLLPDSCYQA